MKEKIKKYKYWLIIIIIFLFVPLIINHYRYNKCVEVEKEELIKCKNGNYGNYDCSVFENPEEKCDMKIYKK
ncbi:MAG: hypothetical protein ISS83_01530 [Candidatus Pacebacteria bacterium]|nr:hypothetical protein [Candidatus Paceibacterota bacterium]